MLPVNTGGHSAYQNFVVENLRNYYPNPDCMPKSTWEIMKRFYLKDLTQIDVVMRDRYSVFGPSLRLPSFLSWLWSLPPYRC